MKFYLVKNKLYLEYNTLKLAEANDDFHPAKNTFCDNLPNEVIR